MTMPKIFVISFPDAHERRTFIGNQLAKLNLDYEFFDAIDGREMDVVSHPAYDAQKRERYFGRHLTGGELGCLLSHSAIYQKIIDDNIPLALILEDDCVLHDDLPAVLNDLSAKTDTFECIRFLGSDKVEKRGGRKVMPAANDRWLVRLPNTPGGAYATLVTQEGAHKILKHLRPSAYPVDAVLARCWETGLNAYTIIPRAIGHKNELGSQIGDTRFDKAVPLKGLKKILFLLRRTYHKTAENIGKRWFFFSTYWKDKALHP